jgi:AcrR family transcriptional regulator
MARPTVIRNEAILDAARAVFLERGILATSAEVAQRAGVSEGSLFKRFKTKADLFRAAMGLDVEAAPPGVALLASRVGVGSVEANLVEAGLDAIAHVERIFPIAMMSWSNPKLNDCLPFSNHAEPPPLKLQRLIADYLEAEVALGRVGAIDAAIVARTFMGAISGYVFSELMSARRGLAPIDREAYIREYVKVLWGGMRPVERVRAGEPRARASSRLRRSSGVPAA